MKTGKSTILTYMSEEQDPFLSVCTIFSKTVQHIFLIPDRALDDKHY